MKMFNDRLEAFAINKEKCGYIGQEFAQQICRTLISRKAFTFRNFIQECRRRFQSGDFGILIANPVSINDATLKNILELLRANPTINEGINEILSSSMSDTDKAECFQLLLEIFIQKKFIKESDVFQSKSSHLNTLENAELITKSSSAGKTSWSISKELIDFNTLIHNKFSYSLDDYFLKLFEKRLGLKIDKCVSEKKEFTIIEKLIAHLRNRNDSISSSVRSTLEESLGHHKQIVLDINSTPNPVSFNKFKSECRVVLKSLSDAVAIHSGLPANGIEFWDDFWQYPDSLANFLKVLETQSSAVEPSNVYLFSAYESAFTDIVSFLLDRIEKNDIIMIPSTNLKNEEIKEFDRALDDYRRANYTSAARRISRLVEDKLREFTYSVFVLQYGDSNHRFQRIPNRLHSTIREHMSKDKERGFTLSKNELTYLNRQHYYFILADKYGIGYDNWMNTFSKIFAGWDVVKMRNYLYLFKELNLIAAHNKEEVLTAANQSDVYQYIIDSIRLIVMINRSYFTFLETVKKAQIPGSTEIGYYFSLDENKYSAQPVRVSEANQKRIISLLKESVNSIDLSCPSFLEQRYMVDYRELFAILADILNGNTSEVEAKVTKKEPIIVLKVK